MKRNTRHLLLFFALCAAALLAVGSGGRDRMWMAPDPGASWRERHYDADDMARVRGAQAILELTRHDAAYVTNLEGEIWGLGRRAGVAAEAVLYLWARRIVAAYDRQHRIPVDTVLFEQSLDALAEGRGKRDRHGNLTETMGNVLSTEDWLRTIEVTAVFRERPVVFGNLVTYMEVRATRRQGAGGAP